jgi:hypothetical protein
VVEVEVEVEVEVVLYESILLPTGPVYKAIGKYALKSTK